jgi:2-polyprenyl-6-methoxyphenol hydroxylase-like FAD-dependent oxidoreductase
MSLGMKKIETDIVISGGGVAGLTAAAAFGTAGFDVVIVDPAPPVTWPMARVLTCAPPRFCNLPKLFLSGLAFGAN